MSLNKVKINIWLILLLLVLTSNFVLYKTQLGDLILTEETNPVVFGSLLDLVVISPILFMLYKKKFSWKMAVALIATGCITAKVLIPASYLQPFDAITWTGIALEAAIVIFEISLIISFIRYMPKIRNAVRKSVFPAVFSFPQAVDKYVQKNPIIHVICSEALMFYYLLVSWKKKPRNGITIYKSSNYIAFQIMLIHAIVIETIGVHWMLHIIGLNPIVLAVMLILNIYGIFFIIADIQTLRLNPIYINNDAVYISQGLMKRAEIRFDNIEKIITAQEVLQSKLAKNTLQFVAKDFEKVFPDVIIKLNKPIKATLTMGLQKEYSQVAIRTDSPAEFLQKLQSGFERNRTD